MKHRLHAVQIAGLLAAGLFLNPLQASDDLHGEPVGTTMPLGDRPGNPTFQLPENVTLLSPFGERPEFSPDGTKIAFIGKSYGDAFAYDLASGTIRNLTSHAAHNGFLRVHYLPDGSFLLLGPRVPAATREATRTSAIELFWMDAQAKGPPVALQRTVMEGIAVSRTANIVAWAEIHPLVPTLAEVKSSTVMRGTVVVANGRARLENVRRVLETDVNRCVVETQDFLPGDRGLLMPCYYFSAQSSRKTDVVSVDFATGQLTTYPTPARLYGEVEGMFPDGKRALVECSEDRAAGMDLCLLELRTENPRYTRLTRIMDFGRWKYGNPVVSPDGRTIAAQIGAGDVEAGVGQGIVLMKLPKGF
jgi:hypothetical protein